MPINDQIADLVSNTSQLLNTVNISKQSIDNAATLLTTHEGESDPHEQYVREETDLDVLFLQKINNRNDRIVLRNGDSFNQGPIFARDLQDVLEISQQLESSNQGGMIELPTNKEFTLDQTITLNIAKVGLNLNGSRINSNINQPMFILDYSHSNPNGVNRTLARSRFFGGGTLNGPGKTTAGSEAIQLNGTQIDRGVRPTLKDLVIHGFDIGIDMLDRSYLSMSYGVDLYQCKIAIRQQSAVDSGENCSWFGGVIANCDLALHLVDSSSEHFFIGYSFDYVRQLLVSQGSPTRTNLLASHIEVRGGNLVSDPDNYVLDGTGTDSRSVISGRDSFIDIDGNGSHFLMVGGVFDINDSGGAGPYNYQQLVNARHKNSACILRDVQGKNLRNINELFGTGSGDIIWTGRHMAAVPNRHMPARITNNNKFNKLLDGGIEDSSMPDRWSIFRDGANLITTAGAITNRLTGTNGSISRSTSQFFSGSSSLRFTKLTTGANTQFRAGVTVPVDAGERLSFFARVFKPATGGISGGNIFVSLRYGRIRNINSDGTYSLLRIGDEVSAFTINTDTITTGSWSIIAIEPFANGAAGDISAPSWADCLTVQIYADGSTLTTGDLFFDDFFIS